MLMILMIIFFLFCIPMILFLINIFIYKKMFMSREKMSPFECGFDPISNSRLPFSIQFFIISLIFLIFDIEISLILPIIFLSYNFNPYIIIYSLCFLIILILGLYIEYLEFSIDWKFF